jgi:hypothetical protein
MIQGSPYFLKSANAHTKQIQNRIIWALLLTGFVSISTVLGYLFLQRGPDIKYLAWFVYLIGIAAIIVQPRWGVYLILFFGLVGDSSLLPWYPFIKNFSSGESIFYVNNSLIVSPMETYILLALAVWLGRDALLKKSKFFRGPLFKSALVLMLFIVFGFIYGRLNGGNTTIALWEIRPFFHMFAMLVLGTNLLDRKEHYNHVLWWAVMAIFIKCLMGLYHYIVILGGSHPSYDAFTDHAASIQINSIFIVLLAVWMYNGSLTKKMSLVMIVPVLGVIYMLSQRRAAFAALAVAVVFLAVFLFIHNRRMFWLIVPISVVLISIYVAAFWNNTGPLGLPSRAIKSVIALESASSRDISSNVYRIIENINTGYTVQQAPLTGVGFGNTFLVIIPMDDISFFAWWNYFPHNSIIYLWVKTGIGGFLALIFLFGNTIITGTRVVLRVKDPDIKVLMVSALLYVTMHFIYAYVDIAWDTQSMLYLGTCIAVLNSAERVLSAPKKAPQMRYPWQKAEMPIPELLPFP